MRQRKGNISSVILCILACGIIGAILITAANYIPVNPMTRQASLEELDKEGLFPALPGLVYSDGDFHSFDPGTLELATDALMVKMALYEGEGQGIYQAFYAYSTHFEEEYSRYWHGYVVLLRPLLYFFDYWEIRILNGILQMLLVFALAMIVGKARGMKYALAIVSVYILLMPMALAFCLQYSWIFYVTIGMMWLLAGKKEYWLSNGRYCMFFALTGCLAIYFDLMTYPFISWGLPVVLLLLLSEESSPLGHLRQVVASGICWLAGYLGMWVMKWIIGSAVLRQNLFARAMEEMKLWLFNGEDQGLSFSERMVVLYENVSTYTYKLFVCLLLIWFCFFVYRWIRYGIKVSAKTPALLLITVGCFVWYFVMAGHSQMHHIFTHRIFTVPIFAGLIFGSITSEVKADDREKGRSGPEGKTEIGTLIQRPGRQYAMRAGVILLACTMGFIAMLQLRTDRIAANWEQAFEPVELRDGSFEAEYTPTASRIQKIAIGVGNTAQDGCYRVSLLQDGAEKEQTEISMSEYGEGHFIWKEVDWRVSPGKTYIIKTEALDTGGVTNLWVTAEPTPLKEI
nr:hypothetical protein [Lachnospiraceae bacterium]